MAGKIDPFDIKALGDAVNDSASRVSTIWVSFLIFSLYLLTAASTVTHRQLFLADPVKLPVLNIDLPLWGFFFLAPILFVIFHIYVLLQVLLLAHTAAAYNAAVEHAGFAKGFGAPSPARVSSKHTLALVNTGNASAADLLALAREIVAGVQAAYSVTLTPEPILIGASL